MAENDSILGVVVDPEKAESGSKRVNAALDRMESKGNDFARKFDSSISNTFNKFASSTSSSFNKLQSVASSTFTGLTKSAKSGADDLVKYYDSALKQIQDKLNKTKLDTSKAALFQGSKLQAQVVGSGFKNESTSYFEKLKRDIKALDDQMTAFWAKQKALPALLKAAPSMSGARADSDKLFNTLYSQMSKVSSLSSSTWGKVATGASSAFNTVQASASKSLNTVQTAFQKMWAGIQSIYSKITSGGSGGGNGGGMFSGLGAWFAGAGIYLAIDKFIDKLVDANNTYNSFIATLHAGKMTSEQANEEYDYLLNLANSMGVEFSSLTRSYAKFTAATMDSALAGKAAKEVFESIVTVSTVLHSKGYDTERMFYAITQSISKGRIYREELVQQLAEKLPGAMNLAAKSMGMNIKQLNKSLTDGTLDVSEFWLKFSQGLKDAYGGAAAEAAKMVEANINRLKNAVEVAFVNIGQSGAIDGFINLIKSLTTVINSATTSSSYFGKTFGDAANMLADWINSLSPQDIDSVIKGVTGIFDAFIRSIKVFIGQVGDFGSTKFTFIDFAEGVSKSMLMISGVLADTINLFKVLFTYFSKPVQPKIDLKGVSYAKLKSEHPEWSSDRIDNAMAALKYENTDKMAKYNRDMVEYNKNLADSWDNVGTGMKSAKQQSDEMTKLYAKMRQDNASISSTPFSAVPKVDSKVPQPLSKSEFDDLLSKIQSDPNYNSGTGKGDKAAERKQLSVMKAYWNERETQIKQLAKMNIDEANIMDNLNPLYEYNVRLEKEKIAADERLVQLSKDLKDKLLENAAALDAQAISLENTKARMSDYMQTYQMIITAQEQANQLNSGGLKQFNEADNAKRSTMFGGANQYLDAATKQQLIRNAALRDAANVDLSAAQMKNDYREEIIQMQQRNALVGAGSVLTQQMTAAFNVDNQVRKISIGLTEDQAQKFKDLGEAIKTQLSSEFFNSLKKSMEFELSEQIRELEFRNQLIGLTSVEQAKLNEQFRIESMIRRETLGMSDEQKKQYEDLANVIKNKLTKSIQDNADIQRSAATGVKNAIASYIDEITNYAAQAQNTISGLFKSLEDTLTNFITTGKLSLGDFFNQIKTDLARALVRQTIMEPLLASVKGALGSIVSSSSGSGVYIPGMTAGSASGNSTMSIISTISKAFNGFDNTFKTGLENLGAYIANSDNILARNIGGFMGQYSAQISSAIGYGGAVLQAAQGNWAGAAGSALGTYLSGGNPIVGAIGGALGSALGGALGFGKKKIPRFSSQSVTQYNGGDYKTRSFTPMYKALNATAQTSSLNSAYFDNIAPLFKQFGIESQLGSASTRVVQKRKASYAEFEAMINGKKIKSGETGSAKTTQKTFDALVNKVFSESIVKAVNASTLGDGIKSLFKLSKTKDEVQAMMASVINLGDAQDALTANYNLTADQAAKVSAATGLAGTSLSDFVNKLASAATGLQTVGTVIVKQRDKLTEQFTSVGGGTALPENLKAFDALLKSIDTSTADGATKFADLFQLRDAFAAMNTTIQSLKDGVNSAIFDMSSPAEQLAIRQKNLADAFEELNLTVPGSLDELIALGKTIDFTTADGLTLASVFPTLVEAFNATQDAADSLIDSLRDAPLDINKFRSLFEYNRATSLTKRFGVSAAGDLLSTALPSFAVGTNYVPDDMVANIHKGERIIPAADNADLINGNSDVAYEIAKLRDEQRAMLVSMTRSLASVERKIARIDSDGVKIAQYDSSGNPTVITVKVEA